MTWMKLRWGPKATMSLLWRALALWACLLLLATAGGTEAHASGQRTPDTAQLVRYPYVQSTTSSSTMIAWATDIGGASEVRYSTDQSYSQVAAATSTLVNGQYYHAATLTGLSAHTTYYYKIFTRGSDLTPWPTVAFTTATTGDSFTFVAYGDSRDGSQAARDLSAQMKLWSFDLALHSGDITLSGQYDEYQNQYFAIYSDTIRSIPFFTSLGNHDYGANPPQPYLDVFYLPENAPAGDREEYYSFNWGNAHFIALDTNQSYAPGSAQYNWLVNDLENTHQYWKFVFFHHPPYSSSAHGSDLNVRNTLGPVFEKYHVALVFTGHDHDYERTWPMLNGAVSTAWDGGVVYVVTGGGGAPLYPAGADDFTAYSSSRYHFVRVQVAGCKLSLQAIDINGNVFDAYELSRCWTQVNDDAFGLDDPSSQTPPYQGEDGFEVAVFKGQLYVGMEADNLYGARVWRTKAGVTIARSQEDWEQAVDDAFGDVNNNDHIDSLEPFNGYLYASTAMRDENRDGTEVWRSSTGDAGTWSQVNDDGFGTNYNENFKDMAVFTVDGSPWLCGGTMNKLVGAQVWCTDGSLKDGGPKLSWVQKNRDGFGDARNIKIWSTGVFKGHLYVGVERYITGAHQYLPGTVWRTDGTPEDTTRWQWEQVFTATANSRVDIIGPFNGYLYIGFDGGNGTEVWRSSTGDAGTWSQVNDDGFGDANNGKVIVDAGTVYNGALYLATLNQATGAEVWRTTDGTTWTQVNADGFGDGGSFAAELIPFNGYLYAWVTNYSTGQKVMRTKCPVCQNRPIAGPGTYTFDGVGAVITFTQENLTSVEVCVYPDAFPTGQMSDKPVKRHYRITPAPSGGTFTADLTLSYTDDEFAASDIGTEGTTYLVRWTGSEWSACPIGNRSRDTAANTVTCSGVTAFSTWAIAVTCPDFVDPPGVGVEDIQAVAAHWRQRSTEPGWDDARQFDLDGDGDIDIVDIMRVTAAWGTACQ